MKPLSVRMLVLLLLLFSFFSYADNGNLQEKTEINANYYSEFEQRHIQKEQERLDKEGQLLQEKMDLYFDEKTRKYQSGITDKDKAQYFLYFVDLRELGNQRMVRPCLDSAYWWVVVIGVTFTLARFSEAFLVMRAHQTGIPIALVPLVMVTMNIIYSLSAYPFGKLSDRMSHRHLLMFGLVILIVADLVLAFDHHWFVVLIGVMLWGIHLGMTQGLLATMVANTAPANLRGTAYGFFNLICGLAILLASILAGLLWDQFGASVTFYAGAVFCMVALAALTRLPEKSFFR